MALFQHVSNRLFTKSSYVTIIDMCLRNPQHTRTGIGFQTKKNSFHLCLGPDTPETNHNFLFLRRAFLDQEIEILILENPNARREDTNAFP